MRMFLLRCRALPRRLCGIALALLAAAGAASAAPKPDLLRQLVRDPHYGDTLFHFYQDQYFTAVTSLMVSQHFGRMPHHVDDAEILRGGLLLSYGLHREAGDIFAQLIERKAAPEVRDRAWYYLAKIRYQRGFLAEAEDAMARIENYLPPDLQEERLLLLANLLMARGRYDDLSEVLNELTPSTSAGLYARYNLGVALVRSGHPAEGATLLDQVGLSPAASEEFRSLRDQANVALGFSALQQNRPEAARLYLERVRLSGLHANKALLGFGWAAAALRQPKQALVPWTELATRDAGDAAVLEARIAVPYAFAELGAFGQSLQHYNDAIAVFERETASLDESIAAIRSGKLVQGLMERNPGEEMGWFWNIADLPDMPHTGHLAQVLAQHQFQEAFKNYRDLDFLGRNLQTWSDALASFGDVVNNRRQAYAERLPRIRAAEQAGNSGLQQLQQQRDALSRELARVEGETDVNAFARAKERDLLTRLESVRAALERAGDDPELAQARERYRLAAGALSWQLAEEYPVRVWEANKGLKALDAELALARERDANLARAQRDEPAKFARFDERIGEMGQRIRALIPRVAALHREQQQQVQEIAVAQLLQQKERLVQYTMQARFAVAQLYDRGSVNRKDGHVPAQ